MKIINEWVWGGVTRGMQALGSVCLLKASGGKSLRYPPAGVERWEINML